MKKLILFLTFVLITRLGSAQATYFTMDSVWVPPYICQAHIFNVEIFGIASSGSVQSSTQNYYVSNDTIYVEFHFVSGTGPATPYPFHRNLVIPAQNLGQYKIMVQGFYNGQLHKTLTSGISICAGILANPEPDKAALTLTVFPNPVKEMLDLTVAKNKSGLKLTLTNVIGRTLQTKVLPAGTLQTRLDLRSLPAGVYLLQVSSPEKKIIQKIIKH